MKTPLKLSILLNGCLLAALGILSARHVQRAPVAATAIPEMAPPPSVPAAPPFHWNQLESTNGYRAYVANLRAIGCPEPTIRAIVTADFAAATSFERRRLELAGKSTSPFSLEATQRAIASMLNNDPVASHADDSRPTTAAASPARPETAAQPAGATFARASYPVAFQSPVLSDASLTENQKAAVRQLQQQFVDAVGGPNQDPSDPAYRARWQTAQQDADDALRAQLGNQAYLAYKQQHYYSNFQQVMLNASGSPVTINPEDLAR